MVARMAFTQSPRWRLSFSEWAWVGGSATPISSSSASRTILPARDRRQGVVQVNGRGQGRDPVPEVEALVLGVGAGVGVDHAHENAGRPLEQIDEGVHEAAAAARPYHSSVLP